MIEYDFNDASRQKRYEAKQAEGAVTSLNSEIAVLRTLLEESLQNNQNRLALDVISALTKLATATEQMQVRAQRLLPLTRVNQFVAELSHIIKLTLDETDLSQETVDEIINGILARIAEKKATVLLLERKT